MKKRKSASKIIYIVLGAAIVGLGVYYFSHYRPEEAKLAGSENKTEDSQASAGLDNTHVSTNSAPVSSAEPSSVSPKPPATAPPGSHFSDEQDIEGNDVQVYEVDYNGMGFTPASLSIKAGDIVVFKNKSNLDFWPASNPHPTHTDYPGFDAGQSLAPGKSFQFKFVKTGSWKFHNHLNPSQGAVINVSAH